MHATQSVHVAGLAACTQRLARLSAFSMLAHLSSVAVGSQPSFFSTSFCTSAIVAVGDSASFTSSMISVFVSIDSWDRSGWIAGMLV